MSDEDILAAAGRLEELILPFERLFGKEEARRHARTYLRGLMSGLSRKSIEPIAREMGGGRLSALQKFVNAAPWRASSLFKEVQREFGAWLKGLGPGSVVLTIHEHSFVKKGRESVGVARQWNATTRRNENSQVGIYLVATAGGVSCLLDSRLYLPATWCDGSEPMRRRRLRTHVPVGSHHQSKAQIAIDLLRRCRSMGLVEADWAVVGEDLGNDGELGEGLGPIHPRFLIRVPPKEVVLVREPLRPQGGRTAALPPDRGEIATTASDLCEVLPSDLWRTARIGDRGQILHERFATIRVRSTSAAMGPRPLFLVIRDGSDPDCESLKYYLSDTGPEASPDEIAAALHRADSASGFFRDAERYLGLDHYETRSWDGWHHHMSLVALAHWFASSARAGRSAESREDSPSVSTPSGRERS